MKHPLSSKWSDTTSPPDSRPPHPSDAPNVSSHTGYANNELEEKTQSTPLSGPTRIITHRPRRSREIPTHNSTSARAPISHRWSPYDTVPGHLRTSSRQDPPRSDDQGYSAAWDPSIKIPQPPDSAISIPHPPGRQAPSHKLKSFRDPIVNPRLSHVASLTNSRTPHPSELSFRRSDPEYSAAWDTSANAPPLPVAAVQFEDSGRAGVARGSSGSSSVASTGSCGYRDQQGNKGNKDYGTGSESSRASNLKPAREATEDP